MGDLSCYLHSRLFDTENPIHTFMLSANTLVAKYDSSYTFIFSCVLACLSFYLSLRSYIDTWFIFDDSNYFAHHHNCVLPAQHSSYCRKRGLNKKECLILIDLTSFHTQMLLLGNRSITFQVYCLKQTSFSFPILAYHKKK